MSYLFFWGHCNYCAEFQGGSVYKTDYRIGVDRQPCVGICYACTNIYRNATDEEKAQMRKALWPNGENIEERFHRAIEAVSHRPPFGSADYDDLHAYCDNQLLLLADKSAAKYKKEVLFRFTSCYNYDPEMAAKLKSHTATIAEQLASYTNVPIEEIYLACKNALSNDQDHNTVPIWLEEKTQACIQEYTKEYLEGLEKWRKKMHYRKKRPVRVNEGGFGCLSSVISTILATIITAITIIFFVF